MDRPRLTGAERKARDRRRKQDQALKAAIGEEVLRWLEPQRMGEAVELGIQKSTADGLVQAAENLKQRMLAEARQADRRVRSGTARAAHSRVAMGGEVLRWLRVGREGMEGDVALAERSDELAVLSACSLVLGTSLTMRERGEYVLGLADLRSEASRVFDWVAGDPG